MKAKRIRRAGLDPLESQIQEDIMRMLLLKKWLTKSTHGSIFQYGFPDIYAAHRSYGARWIEVKNPNGFSFTPAQLEFFPLLAAHGVGVWILTSATEHEYEKLFCPANWYWFLGKSKL